MLQSGYMIVPVKGDRVQETSEQNYSNTDCKKLVYIIHALVLLIDISSSLEELTKGQRRISDRN